jgi:predicted PurR-regulated permease PerM
MKTTSRTPFDVTHITLAVLFICMLIASSFWILRPFLISIIWALLIVVATWPVLLRLQTWLWGRRTPAVAAMTVALLMVVFIPLTLAVLTIVANAEDIAARIKSLAVLTVSPPPDWLERIPLVGGRFSAQWREFAALAPEERSAMAAPYAGKALRWFVAQAGSIGMLMIHFLLTVIIAAVMYAKGEIAAAGILSFVLRLAGGRGEEVAVLAAKAIRGVAMGIVLTALMEATVGGIGLAVTGVPAAGLLTAVMFMLCLAQIGPLLVLVPAVIWLYLTVGALGGTILLAFLILTVAIDHIIRPLFIKKGADLPLIMVFAGVIGGLLAFGIVGLFIGPVVLAVTYTLLKAWVSAGTPEDASVSEEE